MASTEIINILDEKKDEGRIPFKFQHNHCEKFEVIAKNLNWIVFLDDTKVRIHCVTGTTDTMWSVDANFTITFNTTKEDQKNHIEVFNGHFGYMNEVRKFITLRSDLQDAESFYTGEVHVQVRNTNRLRCYAYFGYIENLPSNSDVILLIEGRKVLVNSEYLSAHSPVFKSMFTPDTNNKQENEFAIEGVKLKHFLNFLRAFYFHFFPVLDEAPIIKVLELADRFEVRHVINVCERSLVQLFMARNMSWNYLELYLADRFDMPILQSLAAHKIFVTNQCFAVRRSTAFRLVSTESKFAATHALISEND